MSKKVFINNNKKAIKAILDKIGKEAYYEALKKQGLEEQKPISMNGFYLQFEVDSKDLDIWYRYPGGLKVKLLSALGYWEVPVKGWEMDWKEL